MKLPTRIAGKRKFIVLVYVWWLWLGSGYLWQYWAHPVVAGADGSGHVAAIDLYAKHVYPDTQGWIPEFFGGMPFPVFYPPLFYWLGATLVRLFGLDASTAAKLLTTLSFVALPAALYFLARRFRLSPLEAAFASAWAGVIACGANIPALAGIGLLGLFEVGLYTQTLGFVFFCVWCATLPNARRSRAYSLAAVASLTATILTNVHVLPLAAGYGLLWLVFDAVRTYRVTRRRGGSASAGGRLVGSLALLLTPLLISAFWLLPLLEWYPYALGQPLPPSGLITLLGSFNVTWLACAVVAWRERRRRPALTALCVTLLAAAFASITPVGGYFKSIPFQPWRVASGAVILGSIPLALLCLRSLRELLGQSRARSAGPVLAVALVLVAFVHPMQRFGVASLTAAEGAQLRRVREALRALPPGMVLVENIDRTNISASTYRDIRGDFTSRALTHQLATDGRPVLWAVFREHAASVPLNASVRNLFSTSQGEFGMEGIALHLSSQGVLTGDESVRLARHLGVSYYLLKSAEQVRRFGIEPNLQKLDVIEGWHLFTNTSAASPPVEVVSKPPVLAWMWADFKNRTPYEVEFFNLGELLAFSGHPEICVLWAQSEGTNPWEITSQLPGVIIVIDPRASPPNLDAWLAALAEHGRAAKVLLLDDGSNAAREIDSRREHFAAYERIAIGDHETPNALLAELTMRVINITSASADAPDSSSTKLWRTSGAYFPARRTNEGRAVWLTGQGGAAALSPEEPHLIWTGSRLRTLANLLSLCGVVLALVAAWWLPGGSPRRGFARP